MNNVPFPTQLLLAVVLLLSAAVIYLLVRLRTLSAHVAVNAAGIALTHQALHCLMRVASAERENPENLRFAVAAILQTMANPNPDMSRIHLDFIELADILIALGAERRIARFPTPPGDEFVGIEVGEIRPHRRVWGTIITSGYPVRAPEAPAG